MQHRHLKPFLWSIKNKSDSVGNGTTDRSTFMHLANKTNVGVRDRYIC